MLGNMFSAPGSWVNEVNPDIMPDGPDEGNQGQEANDPKNEALNQFGLLALPKVESNIHVITIVGQVEGHLIMHSQNKTTKYEHIIPQLVAVEQSREIQGLMVVLNTVGGDVEAGLAIAEMIASLSKPCVSLVLGGGHSIGVPIAVAAKTSVYILSYSNPMALNRRRKQIHNNGRYNAQSLRQITVGAFL